MFHVKRHKTTLAAILVLLAAGTGLMWPKSDIQAQYFDQPPTPVKTIPYRQETPSQIAPGAQGWPSHDVNVPMAIWRVRSDGLWVPWTMEQPAWWAAIASAPAMAEAEAIPLPPERLKDKTGPTPKTGDVLSSQKRMARTPDLCERHGLKKTYTDRYRWRCR